MCLEADDAPTGLAQLAQAEPAAPPTSAESGESKPGEPTGAAPLLVTRAEFARLAGVTRSAVSQACRAGHRLAPACSGGRVDLAHPAAREYLADPVLRTLRETCRAVAASPGAPGNASTSGAGNGDAMAPAALDPDELADMMVDVLQRALARLQARRGTAAT